MKRFVAFALIAFAWPATTLAQVRAEPQPDRTPLSCDGKPADFHADRAHRVIDNAYAKARILDPSPTQRSERNAWRAHARCLLDQGRRHRMHAYVDKAAAHFDGLFTRMITPPGAGWLAATRSCENGGSYAYGTNPTYGGAYQFDTSSWSGTASTFTRMTGLPANPNRDALPREQDIRAAIWYGIAGSGAWPVCG